MGLHLLVVVTLLVPPPPPSPLPFPLTPSPPVRTAPVDYTGTEGRKDRHRDGKTDTQITARNTGWRGGGVKTKRGPFFKNKVDTRLLVTGLVCGSTLLVVVTLLVPPPPPLPFPLTPSPPVLTGPVDHCTQHRMGRG